MDALTATIPSYGRPQIHPAWKEPDAMSRETVWSFSTLRFTVALKISPEETDPADSFEFADDIAAVRNGEVKWFVAQVVVLDGAGQVLGSDVLGACAYKDVSDFYTSHRNPDPMARNCSLMRAVNGGNTVICEYFPSMVREAVSEARQTLQRYREAYGDIRTAR